MRKTILSVAISAMVASALAPASAQTSVQEPVFRESRVYFDCGGGAMKVRNTAGRIQWTDEAPTVSVGDGGGCTFVDPGIAHDPGLEGPDDAYYAGRVTGNLRNLTVETYITGPVYSHLALREVPLGVVLTIDGNTAHDTSEPDWVQLQQTATPGLYKVEFTIAQGFRPPQSGEGTQVYEIELHVSPFPEGGAVNWVWGALEAPAGLTFNDATPAVIVGLDEDD